jgi:hypothetical protein
LTRHLFWILMLLSLAFTPVFAQKKKHKKKEKISLFNDSLQTFRKIQKRAKKHEVTDEIFRNIFTLPSPSKSYVGSVIKQNKPILHKADRRIIRQIHIVTLDPFGTDIADTSRRETNIFENAGNIIHLKSKKFAIRNSLLFYENERLDLLKLQESERIIRSNSFISDATIRIDTNYKSKDSVDIIIRTQDRWSINNDGDLTPGNYKAAASDHNFLGTGHEFGGAFSKSDLFDTTVITYRFKYFAPNIKQTFITVGVQYGHEVGNEYSGISINRVFFSPLTKWAGGVDVFKFNTLAVLNSTDTIVDTTKIKSFGLEYWTKDVWFGWAFSLSDTSFQNRTTKLILAARIYDLNYQDGAPIRFDPLIHYQNQTNYLITVGISRRGYYKDKYIYKYGVTEDVPTGALFSTTFGYQTRSVYNRYYLSFRSSYGVKFRGGNASIYFEMGTYYVSKGVYEQGVLNNGIQGFSNIIKLPYRMLFRQFMALDVTIGLNRNANDRITINDVKGLKGFNPVGLSGSNKMVLSSVTILYLPWQMLGFRIAPIFYCGLGMIGDENVSFFKDNIFPVLGIGLQIRNEYLMFNSFLITIGFYPFVPNVGSNLFKMNPFGRNDYQFQNFGVGKPGEVVYY